MTLVTRYRLGWGYPILAWATSLAFVAVAVIVIPAAFFSPAPLSARAFVAVWLILGPAGAAFNLAVAYELRVDQEQLLWKAPLRSGAVPLRDIREIRCALNRGLIRTESGRKIRLYALKGFVPFAQSLAASHSWIQVRISLPARFAERLPGPSYFRS